MRLDKALDWPSASSAALPLEPEVLNAAAALGEDVRQRFGGRWVAPEDTLYGEPHVAGISDLADGKFFPLPLLEAAWHARQGDFLARFVAALPGRLKAERERWVRAGIIPTPWAGGNAATGKQALEITTKSAQDFRAWMGMALGGNLPLSLVGVRELDRFLRSHYYLNCLPEQALVGGGFFLGETARGLFGGTWSLKDSPPWDRAALHWPELPYYPVGRIYKMMTQRPPGDALDEYLRVIPSARRALAAENAADPRP